MSLFFSHISGWSQLAKVYRDSEPLLSAQGDNCYWRSGSIGEVRYKSCLNLRVCKSGLRMSTALPFRIGHPPLFIPWDAFHTVSVRRGFFLCAIHACIGWPVLAKVDLPIWLVDHLPEDPPLQAKFKKESAADRLGK